MWRVFTSQTSVNVTKQGPFSFLRDGCETFTSTTLNYIVIIHSFVQVQPHKNLNDTALKYTKKTLPNEDKFNTIA
jgi:hypothetical protein